MSKFYGVYRGIVRDNNDASVPVAYRCRIKVHVPQVYSDNLKIPDDLPWAEPCVPLFGGGQVLLNEQAVAEEGAQPIRRRQGTVAIPPIGSTVWVMFENGNPANPVWIGTWYGRYQGIEIPTEALRDFTSGSEYPKIFVLKFPWPPNELFSDEETAEPDGMYIRVVDGSKIEIVFHANDNYIMLDAVSRSIRINTVGWNTRISSRASYQDGGGNVVIDATPAGNPDDAEAAPVGGQVSIQARTINIDATDEVRISARNKTTVFGRNQNVFSSQRMIVGMAPNASGFEDH